MVSKKAPGRRASVDEMFGQAFVAIGQGAAGVMLTRDAVREVRKRYVTALRDNAAEWDGRAVAALELARGLGRLAAHHALASHRNEIRASDIRYAAGRISRASLTIDPKPCPIC
jgi:hypothetical protein